MTDAIKWFHSLDLNGEVMPGIRPADVLETEAEAIFSHSVKGKSVLDIGAWDGFFSFEAERRGAKRVLSTDHFCWSGPGWGTKAGYDHAHQRLSSRCESLDVDVFDLDPEKLGKFDVVLFLGVLYHLTNPYDGLRKAADMAGDLLIVETVTAQNRNEQAVLQYYENDSLDGDPTNFFAPNTKALAGMLREIGFPNVEVIPNPAVESPAAKTPAAEKRKWFGNRAAGQEKHVDRARHIAFAWR
ncbi:methyltransferase type 11 [Roseovarius sp. TE539]|uniref:class I SAM-dependent methyltransferase n=1 Tax=Roseovarius sp. TE539 TaxID=2249812 RepID=UPI000DE09A8A|nr:DUF1698 domain-containing protein [Roseovarius sp. TE539]RBI71101.1 methyltransferase type 11 [Roseovarius sp. TE539]